MICKECKSEITTNSRFCSVCGVEQLTNGICQKCNNTIALDSKFCSICGTKQKAHEPISDRRSISWNLKVPFSNAQINIEEDKQNQEENLPVERNYGATIVGCFVLLIGLYIYTNPVSFAVLEEIPIVIVFFIQLVFAVIITFWVIRIANKLNRNIIGWGLFAFFFSAPALIIIGLLNPIRKN